MVSQQLIRNLVNLEDAVVPTLFKPVQFDVIKKLDKGRRLTENEKRYLRGKMKKKFSILQEIACMNSDRDDYSILLNSIGSYYITGLEALKHNGYGWYYEPKVIEVINTKIEGKLALKRRTIKFIRVKSISNSRLTIDKKTGLRYATNEQIIKDASFIKNEYTRRLWNQMLSRYKNMFVKDAKKFGVEAVKRDVDYSKYGV